MSQYPLTNLHFIVSDTVEDNRLNAYTSLLYEIHEPLHKYGQMVINWRRILARKERRKTCIVMAYKGSTLIGACICYVRSGFIATYVKPEHRGKGVASAIIRELRQHHNLHKRVLSGDEGFKGWENFFARNRIMREETSCSITEVNEWSDRGKGSLLTFINFKRKRQMLALMRQDNKISNAVTEKACNHMGLRMRTMPEVRT